MLSRHYTYFAAGDSNVGLGPICGYIPLALRLTATNLAKQIDLSPADFLRRLADAGERLKRTGVDVSLSLSLELLGPELEERWRTLAVFPDTFDNRAAAAVWELEPDPAQDVLSRLVAHSLVEWKEETAHYRLHELVRLFADTRMKESERTAARQRHTAYYKTVASDALSLYIQGGKGRGLGMALFDQEWENIKAGQTWAAARGMEDDAAAILCIEYAEAGAIYLTWATILISASPG